MEQFANAHRLKRSVAMGHTSLRSELTQPDGQAIPHRNGTRLHCSLNSNMFRQTHKHMFVCTTWDIVIIHPLTHLFFIGRSHGLVDGVGTAFAAQLISWCLAGQMCDPWSVSHGLQHPFPPRRHPVSSSSSRSSTYSI